MVSAQLKNISQNGNLPQIGVKITNIWNHHPDIYSKFCLQIFFSPNRQLSPKKTPLPTFLQLPHLAFLRRSREKAFPLKRVEGLKCSQGRGLDDFQFHRGVSENRGAPKWMVYNGKPYWNGWFGGTPILGNIHRAVLPNFSKALEQISSRGIALLPKSRWFVPRCSDSRPKKKWFAPGTPNNHL